MSNTSATERFIISVNKEDITDNEKAFDFWSEKLTNLPVSKPKCVTVTFKYKTKEDPTKIVEYTTSKLFGWWIAKQDLNSENITAAKPSTLYLYIGAEDVERFYPNTVSIRTGDEIGVPCFMTPSGTRQLHIAVLFSDLILVSII